MVLLGHLRSWLLGLLSASKATIVLIREPDSALSFIRIGRRLIRRWQIALFRHLHLFLSHGSLVKSQSIEGSNHGGLTTGLALGSRSLQWLIDRRRIWVPVGIEHDIVVVLRYIALKIVMLSKEADQLW